jgi:DNA-directed RNA polymerase I, II, and III subunit RPABC1
MTETSDQTNALYKSRRTILALLESQGYDTSSLANPTVNEVHVMAQTKQLDFVVTNPTTGNKAKVLYHLGKTLRPVALTEIINADFEVEKNLGLQDSLLVVARLEPNETLTRTMQLLWEKQKIYVNVFNIERLQFNILEHSYVPPHRVLSEEERDEVVKEYNIVDNNIPTISRFDPVAQAISLRPGQYCLITRPSKTAIQAPFYRVCV